MKFKLVRSEAGHITITDNWGDFAVGFSMPDGDGRKFNTFMNNLKRGNIIVINSLKKVLNKKATIQR